jgi:Ricin-type beta-trefoil lectin domain
MRQPPETAHVTMKRAGGVVGVLAVAITLLTVFAGPAYATPGSWAQIKSYVDPTKCLYLNGNPPIDETIKKQTCVSGAYQQLWGKDYDGTGWFRIQRNLSSKCMATVSTANFSQVWSKTCSGSTDTQRWRIYSTSGGDVMLQNKYSGKCLTLRTTDTVALVSTCTSALYQWFNWPA